MRINSSPALVGVGRAGNALVGYRPTGLLLLLPQAALAVLLASPLVCSGYIAGRATCTVWPTGAQGTRAAEDTIHGVVASSWRRAAEPDERTGVAARGQRGDAEDRPGESDGLNVLMCCMVVISWFARSAASLVDRQERRKRSPGAMCWRAQECGFRGGEAPTSICPFRNAWTKLRNAPWRDCAGSSGARRRAGVSWPL